MTAYRTRSSLRKGLLRGAAFVAIAVAVAGCAGGKSNLTTGSISRGGKPIDQMNATELRGAADSIGQAYAKEICEKVGITAERRVNQLTDAEVLQIRETIDKDYTVEGDLRREVATNIKRLMDLGCYRGLRHRRGLPVRGQRTHTNARTRKGKPKAIAGKKK